MKDTPMNFEKAGKVIDEIPVQISYRIIELFSAGLYSSPNKAFEELVSNSYDAGATKVCISVELEDNLEDSLLWVCDNGTGMNVTGLKEFWRIGNSTKRTTKTQLNRLAIGKFGIGKLATYILTKKLTLISKTSEGFHAVTMDYSRINEATVEDETLNLDERKLSMDDVKDALTPLIEKSKNHLTFKLWGTDAAKSWTFAIMSELKDKSNDIEEGRLKWILRTALPLNPNFSLQYNGQKLESSKEKLKPLKTWVFGSHDKVAQKFKGYEAVKYNGQAAVNIGDLKMVRGQLELYKESLLRGDKSERWGRSHGIFLMVRERLINLDDALLGMDPLSHGVFNRVRIVVHADDLDELITSTRESVKESYKLNDLREYIKRKFQEAKDFYFQALETAEQKNQALFKVTQAASSLTRLPIVNGARKFADGTIDDLLLTQLPIHYNKAQKKELVEKLEGDLLSESGIIKGVVWDAIGTDEPIAKFDIVKGVVTLNLLHPFFSNFLDEVKSPLALQLFAMTEIFTEFYLLEDGLDQEQAIEIMRKRDETLRQLTFSDRPNAPLVANLLKSSVADPTGLEKSVTYAFSNLGFEASTIGGKGKPDGIAVATVGPKNSKDNYSITYDAKSTKKDSIKAMTAHISGVIRHRKDYHADYACVVAVDFEGAGDPQSAVNKEAKENKVSLITARDFSILIILAGPKQLGLRKLRELFETCHTTNETSAWIQKLKNEEIQRGPIKAVLETTYKIMKEDKEPPDISAIRHNNEELKKMDAEQVRSLVQSIAILVPNYVSISGNVVSIQVPPAQILATIGNTVSDVPLEFKQIYLNAFGATKSPKRGANKKNGKSRR